MQGCAPANRRRTCSAGGVVVPLDFLDRIAAEFFEERVGKDERHHRLATTAAAGTAQTSLRSIAAGASAIVVRSTDRSGFIRVEIGFMNPVTRTSWPLVTPPSSPPALLVGRTGASPASGGRISSCTRDPGRTAPSGPMPMPTALIAWIAEQGLAQSSIQLSVPLHV